MPDNIIHYPIPVIMTSTESYDAMLLAEHILVVAKDSRASETDGLAGGPDSQIDAELLRGRRCLINCGSGNVRRMAADLCQTQNLMMMVGG